MEEETLNTWLNIKTTSKLLVITQMKLSCKHVKHMKDERSGKHEGVIQENWTTMCHHETLFYYFEITIHKDVGYGDYVLPLGLPTKNFKKNQMFEWELNTCGYQVMVNSITIVVKDHIAIGWKDWERLWANLHYVGCCGCRGQLFETRGFFHKEFFCSG